MRELNPPDSRSERPRACHPRRPRRGAGPRPSELSRRRQLPTPRGLSLSARHLVEERHAIELSFRKPFKHELQTKIPETSYGVTSTATSTYFGGSGLLHDILPWADTAMQSRANSAKYQTRRPTWCAAATSPVASRPTTVRVNSNSTLAACYVKRVCSVIILGYPNRLGPCVCLGTGMVGNQIRIAMAMVKAPEAKFQASGHAKQLASFGFRMLQHLLNSAVQMQPEGKVCGSAETSSQ